MRSLGKRVSLVTISALAVSLLSPGIGYAATKAGAICTKAGATAIASGKKFTCVKVSKKLVWNKGVTIPSKDPVGAKALTDHEKVVAEIEKLWSKWRAKSTTNYTALKLIVQPGYDPQWNSAAAPTNLLISTFVGNGLTLLKDSYSIFGDAEEWLAATGRPLSCGTPVPEMALGIYCGNVQLGYGSSVLSVPDEKFVNKTLTPSQMKVLNFAIARDVAIMYELQVQYGATPYNGVKSQIPAWIRQGIVELFAALAISDSNSEKKNYYDYLYGSNLIDGLPNPLCTKNLQDYESKDRKWIDSCVRSQNFYAVELLAARHGGFEALFKFVSLYGQSEDWTASFKSAFGISREDFYTEWYDYLKIPLADRPALTPAAPPAHY